MRLLLLTLGALLLSAIGRAQERLPRALILGDSVYTQPARGAADILRGRVEVVRPQLAPGLAFTTGKALEQLTELLGEGEWDLIHFNCGLADLAHRAPGLEAFRVMSKAAGGVRATGPAQYEANLRKLVARLQATGAQLVWASTTPIRHAPKDIFEVDSELAYNAIAARVMAEHGVALNDMHAYVLEHVDLERRTAFDPFDFRKQPLYPPLVRCLLTELGLLRPVAGPVQVFVMVGGWSHIGGGIVLDPNGPQPGPRGSLDHLVLDEATAGAYRHLVDEDGSWATRPDVWIHFDRRGPKSGTLGVGYGGDRKRGIGSELALGHVLGDHFREQVCLVKTALGTPSLASDLRPPGSGQTGRAYTLLLQQISDSLARLSDKFPDYTDESGYELAGLVLNLGEQDADAALYAEYLPLLITDLRAALESADLPVVLVGTGKGGRAETAFPEILAAQQAVAALPRFEGNVAYVETRDFWPPPDARDAYRYPSVDRWYDNAESFYAMGQAVGESMLGLLEAALQERR